MNLEEAKAKLERVARDPQYTAAFKLALLVILDHVALLEKKNSDLELALKSIRNDSIGQPESSFIRRVRMHVDSVLKPEDDADD